MRVWLAMLLCGLPLSAAIAAPVPAPGGREYAETMLLTSESDFDVRLVLDRVMAEGRRTKDEERGTKKDVRHAG